MFYTYKNCTITLQDKEYVAANLSFDINTSLEPQYYAGKKYSHFYKANSPLEATMSFSYYLTGQDHFQDIIYRETEPIRGNFGQVMFPSGYLKSYRINARPNAMAQAQVDIVFFDFEGQLGSGTFTPNTSKPGGGKKIINFLDATINGTGLVDNNTLVTDASFSYDISVTPVYTYQTGTGFSNLKPDGVTFGPKTLKTEVTVDNLSGALPLDGESVLLGIELRHRDSSEVSAYFEARGVAVGKSLSADNQTFASNSISVEQEAPSMLAKITGLAEYQFDPGWGPTGGNPGDIIDVSGINFLSYPDVFIGDYELKDVEYVNDALLRFIVPPETLGYEAATILKNGNQTNVGQIFKSVTVQLAITHTE